MTAAVGGAALDLDAIEKCISDVGFVGGKSGRVLVAALRAVQDLHRPVPVATVGGTDRMCAECRRAPRGRRDVAVRDVPRSGWFVMTGSAGRDETMMQDVLAALRKRDENGGRHLHHSDCIHNLPPDQQVELRGRTTEWWRSMMGDLPEQITPAQWETEPPVWAGGVS